MNIDNLLSKSRRWRRRLTASGSPLRYFRKFALCLSRPVDLVRRISTAAAITRELPSNLSSTVQTLKETGYADATQEVDPRLLAELKAYCEAKLTEKGDIAKDRKTFWANLTTVEDREADSILVRFALQEQVIKMVSTYFGQVPYLADVDISVSFASERPDWEASQLWHLDYADDKTVKFWTYLSDVKTIEDGPFTYVPAGPSRKIPNTFFPGRVKDETIAQTVAPEDVKSVYADRGTCFYIDTSTCYHCGSRVAPGHRRITYVATFLSRNMLHPLENGIKGNGQSSDLLKLVLGR